MKFEIHLTFDNVVKVVKGWKASSIDGDPVLGDGIKFYLTTYAGSEDAAHQRIVAAKKELEAAGFLQHLIREKIEHIVYDRRF